MKKGFKKIMTVALVLALVFSFTVKPKKADASVSMTLAGIAATVGSSAMLPYALGAAGIIAVGGVIKNWDVVKDYGEKVIARMGGYDAATGSYVQNPDGTATVIYSPAMKWAMAQSVDDMPETITVVRNEPVVFYSGTIATSDNGFNLPQTIKAVAGQKVLISYDWTVVDNNPEFDSNSPYLRMAYYYSGDASARTFTTSNTSTTAVVGVGTVSGHSSYLMVPSISSKDFEITKFTSPPVGGAQYSNTTGSVYNLKYQLVDGTSGLPVGETEIFNSADTFGTVADNVNARLLGMNAAISDGQAVTISADAELLNASIDDLASISDATLTETQTQTGILSQIWRGIINLPNSIAAAGVAASTAINTKMTDLWEDAGAIWSGMADTMANIKADMNAKIGSLADSMAGGIDNIRTDVGALMDNLRAGIDTVAANVAAWGQLTLDGIDAGIGAITSGLTTVWEKVGAIPAAIDTAATDARETVTGLFVISEPQKLENQQNMSSARELFLSKFDWIKTPIEQLKSVYSQRKSLHDVSITILGQEVYILPQQFAGTVSMLRSVLSGSAILSTIIYIYRRVQPKEVV